jgi:hypothetical protein
MSQPRDDAGHLIRKHGTAQAVFKAQAAWEEAVASGDQTAEWHALAVLSFVEGYYNGTMAGAVGTTDTLAGALYNALAYETEKRDATWRPDVERPGVERGKLTFERMGREWGNRSPVTQALFQRIARYILSLLPSKEQP